MTTEATSPASTKQSEETIAKKPTAPIEDELMSLARLGEIRGIQKLFDAGKYSANSADEQGITPLHWAAINGHLGLCHFLLQAGADPNVKGGDALATPVLWASKRCQLDIVDFLLQHGADPLITDDAGYNLLHCAALDGNVFQLILLLHQPGIPVDIPDSQGHTSLMWAAYKGFPACVDVLLRWGADVNTKDQMGFTALHWALVKGSPGCIQKLVEYGADRFAANNDGKTPAVTAKEMNSMPQWHRALLESGYDSRANPKQFPVPMVEDRKKFLWRFFYLWPIVVLGVAIWMASSHVIYIGLPLAILATGLLQYAGTFLLKWGPSDFRHIHRTPYFAGVFTATMVWCGIRHILCILPYTYIDAPLLNISFIAFFSACTYFYYCIMMGDPGFVPKYGSRSESKSAIEELISNNAFDESHFCSICMIRKPLRSKHCRRCGRCIAREDHHCPWVDNCVAINNHKHFILYLFTMLGGITSLVRLCLVYLTVAPTPSSATACALLSPALCGYFNKDPFTTVLCGWAALQLTWTIMLLVVHLTQVSRHLTTYESMRGHVVSPIAAALTTGSLDPTAVGAIPSTAQEPTSVSAAAGAAPSNAQSLRAEIDAMGAKRKKDGMCGKASRLLGLDNAFALMRYGSRAAPAPSNAAARRVGPVKNPYSHGTVRNCADFWLDGSGGDGQGVMGRLTGVVRRKSDGEGLLGGKKVDYRRLYTYEGEGDVEDGGVGMQYWSHGS